MPISNRSLGIIIFLFAAAFAGCSKPRPTITQATFEPVYRASKAIQGATGPGVTYARFGELLQALATEIGIARDRPMNDLDKALLVLYENAFSAYKFSNALWKLKIDAHDDMWHGEIPVGFFRNGEMVMADETPLSELAKYGLVPLDRIDPYLHMAYQALPAESIQGVWLKADDILKVATEMYYGRSQQ